MNFNCLVNIPTLSLSMHKKISTHHKNAVTKNGMYITKSTHLVKMTLE